MSIPAKDFVSVNPAVLAAGGAALALSGLILTNSTPVPLGTVMPFSNVAAVSAFFGPSSTEATLAGVYFQGFDNSTQKPGSLLFSQYPTAAVAAYLRSGSLAAMTLAQLTAIPAGTLSVTVDGVVKTTSSINLATAVSFSDAASKIAAAFTGGPTVTYNSQRAAFELVSTTTGAASTITVGSGPIAAALLLTTATGAVTSQGAIAYTPAAAMGAITSLSQNWASFMTTFEPLLADKTAFGIWTAQQNKRFAYVCWDTDTNQIVSGNTTAFGTLNLSGSIVVYNSVLHAAFVMGAIASVDFARTNGRISFAFKSQSGLVPSVSDSTIAATLAANGVNFYADVATSGSQFKFFYPGKIGGDFAWIDSYINQIWLNAQFQTAMINLLSQAGSIPYNAQGYAQIEQACKDAVDAAVNFGAIRGGVTLSSLQKSQVNSSAGVPIDQVLATRGWYFQVKDATPQVRALRGSPPCSFWFMDGGSVQALSLASITLQ